MLFPSQTFLYLFLPLVLAVCWGMRGGSAWLRVAWLLGASLVFYAWWDPSQLPILLGSVLFNWSVGRAVQGKRWLVVFGVAGNVGLLGYYKYANFLATNVEALSGAPVGWSSIVLPLAISFFTFQQIAYLVDVFRGEPAERNVFRYALFVAFFPQLIAGPIVHPRELLPQLRAKRAGAFRASMAEEGVVRFTIGLFKKVVIADGIAPIADPVFGAAHAGSTLHGEEAWVGSVAYLLQLYFDFSGYADMAVGLGLLLGIRLPENFDSPFKATSLSEFWRRWHQTLSRFLRDYVYVPLGGNRVSAPRRAANLFLTLLLGGAWHGAGWTFLVWGALHGTGVAVHRTFFANRTPSTPALVRTSGTFLLLVVSFAMFRAPDVASGLRVWESLFLGPWGRSPLVDMSQSLSILVPLLAVVFLAPNSRAVTDFVVSRDRERWTPAWTIPIATAAVWSCLLLGETQVFLYFQF